VKVLARVSSSRWFALAVIAGAALLYPLAVLRDGAPAFPSLSDCVHPAKSDGNIELVFGYYDSMVRASEMRERIAKFGYEGAEVVSDGGCGRVKVVVGTYPTLAGARDAVAEANSVGLHPTVEEASPL
jgi:hypothetical protein